jgi:hypothetical protein
MSSFENLDNKGPNRDTSPDVEFQRWLYTSSKRKAGEPSDNVSTQTQQHLADVMVSQRQQDPPLHFIERNPDLFYSATRTDEIASWNPSNHEQMSRLHTTLNTTDGVLRENSTPYVLHGSMAQALHKAYMIEAPGDIDILVDNPRRVASTLVASNHFVEVTQGSSMLATRVKDDITGVFVQIHQEDDFGMTNVRPVNVDGKPVLPLYDTLDRLLVRQRQGGNPRQKDAAAFASLVKKRGSELTEAQKDALARKGQAPDWQTLSAHTNQLDSQFRAQYQ